MSYTNMLKDALSITKDMLKAADKQDVEAINTLDQKRQILFKQLLTRKLPPSDLKTTRSLYLSLKELNDQLIKSCENLKSNITLDLKTFQHAQQASNAYSQNQY